MLLLSKIDRALSGGAGRAARAQNGRDAVDDVMDGAAVEAASGIIGERHEAIQDSLSQLADLAEKFRTFEPLLADMRQPLAEEFQARRDAHIELINLRTTHLEMGERVEVLTAENRELKTAIANAEARVEELQALGQEQASSIQEARLELDRLRNALSQSQTRAETLEATERTNGQHIRELEQDQDNLRAQIHALEAARTENEAARTQLGRDYSLASDENEVLKRRMEEVAIEVAGLARAATSMEGQLASERARATAEQAESVRALRGMENQVEAARSEATALAARLETLSSRSSRLDTLNADQAGRLVELQATAQSAERRSEEMQTALERAMERIRGMEAAAEESRQRHTGMEAARLAAVDRAETLSRSTTAQEKALARSEERVAKLQTRLSNAQAAHQDQVQTLTEQVATLRAELEGVRADSAIATAALDLARRERSGREFDADAAEDAGMFQAKAG
ncbi:hypothetical protein [uncultured Brevundimonas sp.]|uniref:hypothetical protein n=1 Tax=uncultured Brevundimonas sp. TaxID=213418 RepID=UPI0030EF90F9|tara:strand:- start:1258 stop:2634 length:1377 start_codon:yes stop_codon:yes gene_type:complete